MSNDLIAALQPKLFMALICVLNMIPCWLLRRDMSGRAVRMLNEATLLFGIGLPMLLFKDWLPRMPTVIVGNMLVLAAMTLLWQVVVGLNGRPMRRDLVPLPSLFWLLCWLVPAFRAELDLRVAIAAGLGALLLLLPVVELLRAGAAGMPRRLLVATGALHAVISVERLLLAAEHSVFADSAIWTTLCQLNTLAYMMLWPALCTVLLNRRSLDEEAERGRRDELSGLLNRRGLLLEIARAGRGTLLLFDIDHFKRINDQFGHASGDDAIIAFARTAARVLGPVPTLGRIGGEEFVALIPVARASATVPVRHASAGGIAVPEDALLAAERVRVAFAALVLPIGLSATVSVGVAGFRAGEPVEQWLARADRALYRAKQRGRDRIELCDGHRPDGGLVAGGTWSPDPLPVAAGVGGAVHVALEAA